MIFKGVSRVFQRSCEENFQGVSKKVHVAWHSSQLPEQKEGLFVILSFQQGVIYQATVENKVGEKETYVGLAANFKKRFYKHRKSMEVQSSDNSTTLSTHFWNEMEAGMEPKVTWKILEKNIPAFNPITGKCQLC